MSEDDEAGVTAVAPPVIVKAAEDPRLRRLAEVCPGICLSPANTLYHSVTVHMARLVTTIYRKNDIASKPIG